jgi:hypothetical protein
MKIGPRSQDANQVMIPGRECDVEGGAVERIQAQGAGFVQCRKRGRIMGFDQLVQEVGRHGSSLSFLMV